MRDDLRYALRSMLRTRLVTVVILLVLGVGIGTLTTLFGFVYTFTFRSLPYPQVERLVSLAEAPAGERSFNEMRPFTAQTLAARTELFTDVVAFREHAVNLSVDELVQPERVGDVTPNVFRMLRATPALGRVLAEYDARAGSPAAVVLSHRIWQRRFGGRVDVVGRTVVIGGEQATVVGVMRPEFSFHASAQLWRPLRLTDAPADDVVHVMARLRDGVSPGAANAQVAAIGRQLAAALPNDYRDVRLHASDELVNRSAGGLPRPIAILFLLASGGVLLVTCANVANLLLARNVARRREMAVRAAVGASRARLLRLGLVESLLLIVAATALGLLLSVWGTQLMTGIVRTGPIWLRFTLDAQIFGFVAGMAALTVVGFGLPIALDASSPRLQAVLGGGGGTAGLTPRRSRRMRALVAAQVALAFTLVCGSVLMLRSYQQVLAVDPGMDAARVLVFRLNLNASRYATLQAQTAFHDELVGRLARAQEADRAAWRGRFDGWWRPAADTGDALALPDSSSRLFKGELPTRSVRVIHLSTSVVTPSYFATVGLALRDGRLFGDEDRQGAPAVTVLSASLADELWPGQRAVGRRVRMGTGSNAAWATVIGVVSDSRSVYSDIRRGMSEVAQPILYFTATQAGTRYPEVLVRGPDEALALVPRVRSAVAAIDPFQSAERFRSLEDVQFDSARSTQRWMSSVMGALGAITLGLAIVGLYGLVAYNVAQRLPEIGVRMALGARGTDVTRMVTRETMRLALIGLGVGLLGAVLSGQLLRILLLDVSPYDPLTLGAVGLLFALVAAAVSVVPARRAAATDPATALRAE